MKKKNIGTGSNHWALHQQNNANGRGQIKRDRGHSVVVCVDRDVGDVISDVVSVEIHALVGRRKSRAAVNKPAGNGGVDLG